MKKLILLLFIPLVSLSSFGQNNNLVDSYLKDIDKDTGIEGTAWEVSYENKSPEWIYIFGYDSWRGINDKKRFRYIILHKRNGQFFSDANYTKTWKQDGNKLVLRSYQHTLSGTISDDGKRIIGTGMNHESGHTWRWEANRIDGDWVYP